MPVIIYDQYAFLDSNIKNYTDNITFAAVPSPPTGPLEIRLVGHNTSTLEWGIPESDGGAPLEGYNIAIRDVSKTMWMEVGRVPAGVQKFHLKDLHDDHAYLIRIFARNEIGSSEPLESDEPYKVVLTGGKCILYLGLDNEPAATLYLAHIQSTISPMSRTPSAPNRPASARRTPRRGCASTTWTRTSHRTLGPSCCARTNTSSACGPTPKICSARMAPAAAVAAKAAKSDRRRNNHTHYHT